MSWNQGQNPQGTNLGQQLNDGNQQQQQKNPQWQEAGQWLQAQNLGQGQGQQTSHSLFDANKINHIGCLADPNYRLKSCQETYKLFIYEEKGENQKFKLVEKGGSFEIVSLINGRVLSSPDNEEGSHIELKNPSNAPNEKWQILPINQGPNAGKGYQIKAFNGLVLDVEGQDFDDATRVIQWKPHQGLNQIWTISSI